VPAALSAYAYGTVVAGTWHFEFRNYYTYWQEINWLSSNFAQEIELTGSSELG
jgi:hypothetical protein